MSKYEPKTPSIWLMLIPFVSMGISGYFLQIKLSDFILLGPFLLVFTAIVFIAILGIFFYIFWRAFYIKNIVTKLRGQGKYINTIITTMEERIGRRNSPNYYCLLCKDIESGEIYDSDPIYNPEEIYFSVGDSVHVYISPKFPSIYWVDLNTIVKGKGELSQKELDEGEVEILEIKKEASSYKKGIKIRFFVISGVMSLFFFKVIFPSLILYFTGVHAVGMIEKIDPVNGVCSSKHSYDDCTIYNTTFVVKSSIINNTQLIKRFILPLSSTKGLDQTIMLSKYKIGDSVNIVINKDHFNENTSIGDSSKIMTKYNLFILLGSFGVLLMISLYIFIIGLYDFLKENSKK